MPAGLDRTDRSLLIGALVLLIALAAGTALLTPKKQRTGTGYPSSYANTGDGAKAAYILLSELGYHIERWDHSPTDLPWDAQKTTLILASPFAIPEKEEILALQQFLERGGRVVATGERAAMLLPEAKSFSESKFDLEDPVTYPALIPSPITSGAPQISMIPPEDWHPDRLDQIALYGDKDTAAVILYPVGKGQVIWWASPSPLSNNGIKLSGNLQLFLNSVGEKSTHHILWDEYFHGARGSLFSYISKTPLPWVFVQFAVIALFVLATFSRRYGTIRMPGKIARLSPLEFVDTLGDLYTSGHAGSAAVRVAYQRLRYFLTRQVGLAANATTAELAHAAHATLGWEEQPLLGSLSRAERAARTIGLSDAEALEIVQDLSDYTARLQLRASPIEARQTE